MSIYDSELWLKDIDLVISNLPWMAELSNKKVMVTGAGGLICSSVVDLLLRYNEIGKGNITVLAAARSKDRIRRRFVRYAESPFFKYIPYDATSVSNNLEEKVDYIIHGANNASPNNIIREPVETMIGNFNGLLNLLDYGKNYGVKRLLYISSSEVYGKKESMSPYKENEYGYIELLNARNSYSVSKRAAETLSVSYAEEYGLESVIARPGHIYGPTASQNDNRVSSQWPYAAAKGEDIVMKSEGTQLRSYCYCLDCASAILTILLKGENRNAYNISNSGSIISIRQMAEIVSKSAGVKVSMSLPSDDEKKGFNPMSNSSVDGSKLNCLGWRGLFDADTGFSHTVKIIQGK